MGGSKRALLLSKSHSTFCGLGKEIVDNPSAKPRAEMTMGIIAVRHVMLDDEEDKKKKPMNPIWLFIAVPGLKNWPPFLFFVIPKGEFMVDKHLYLPSSR